MQSFLIQQFEVCFSEKRLLSCDLFWRRAEEPQSLLCCFLLCCRSHTVPRTSRTLMPMTTRESADTKLSCAPVSQLNQHPHLGILAGRSFRWIVITSNTFFLLLEHAAGMVTLLVLQGEASFRLQGSKWWDTMSCSGSVLLKDTAWLKQEILRPSSAGTVGMGHCVFALGRCCWRTQPGTNKKYRMQPAWSSSCCQQPSLSR